MVVKSGHIVNSVVAVTGQPTSTSKPDLVCDPSDVKFIRTNGANDGIHTFKLIPLGRDGPECSKSIFRKTQKLLLTHELSFPEIDCEEVKILFSIKSGDHDFRILSIRACKIL